MPAKKKVTTRNMDGDVSETSLVTAEEVNASDVSGAQQAMLQLLTAIAQGAQSKEYAAEDIRYSGDGTFVIPAGMTIAQGARALTKLAKDQETINSFDHRIYCAIPADGMASTWRVIIDRFNLVVGRSINTMFGRIPPGFFTIKDGTGKNIEVPRGRFALADFEGDEYLEMFPFGGDRPGIAITGEVRKRRIPFLKEICAEVEIRLKTDSIYRGQTVAYESLEWMVDGKFDFAQSIPVVRKFENPPTVYLNRAPTTAIRSQILNKIDGTASEARSIVFFSGYFGTGKSQQCATVSKYANDHGWTVVHLRSAQDAIRGLKLASMLRREGAGVVIIIEDIDEVASGSKRNSEINTLSTVIDGVEKEAMNNVILIMTTNNPLNVQPVFLRRGRLIQFDLPTMEVRKAMLNDWLDGYIQDDFDFDVAAECCEGFAPSFIKMAVGECISSFPVVTTEIFCEIMESMQAQAVMIREAEERAVNPFEHQVEVTREVLGLTKLDKIASFEEELDLIKEAVGA